MPHESYFVDESSTWPYENWAGQSREATDAEYLRLYGTLARQQLWPAEFARQAEYLRQAEFARSFDASRWTRFNNYAHLESAPMPIQPHYTESHVTTTARPIKRRGRVVFYTANDSSMDPNMHLALAGRFWVLYVLHEGSPELVRRGTLVEPLSPRWREVPRESVTAAGEVARAALRNARVELGCPRSEGPFVASYFPPYRHDARIHNKVTGAYVRCVVSVVQQMAGRDAVIDYDTLPGLVVDRFEKWARANVRLWTHPDSPRDLCSTSLRYMTGHSHRAFRACVNAALNERGLQTLFQTHEGCGHTTYNDPGRFLSGPRQYVCSECFENEVTEAQDTGRLYLRDDLYYWESEDAYFTAPSCEDEDEDEDNERNADRLLGYSTNVLSVLRKDTSFKTSPDGDFHMGVEIETVDADYSPDRKIRAVRAELGDDYLVGKSDGSLPEGGIEFVTRPTSLKVHIDTLSRWESSRKGLTAWGHVSCGMHVHVDAEAFTAMTLGKMIQFYNNRDNADFIRGLAGRYPDRDRQAQSYANFDIAPVAVKSPLTAVKGKPAGARYSMINLCNLKADTSRRLGLRNNENGRYNTVEIRIFRASLLKDRLLAQIEFVHAVIMFCRDATYRDMTHTAFMTWLASHHHSYPWLAKWYQVRPNKHGTPKNDAPRRAATAPAPEGEVENA